MSKYHNGGITLKIGSGNAALKIDTISQYDVTWAPETESFQKYDGSTYTIYKGDRFEATIATGYMSEDEMKTLRNKLLAHTFSFTCPEFPSGISVYLTSLSQPLASANIYGKYYSLQFSVAAVELVNGSGL